MFNIYNNHLSSALKKYLLISLISLIFFINTIYIYADNKEFYVSNLRNRIDKSEIVIEKFVKTTKTFKSYIVSYKVENLKEYALLNIPTTKKPENGYPVIIVNHGYIPPNVYSTINSYRLVTDYYAANGFLVIKPDYRGHDKSENSGDEPYNRLNYVIDVLTLLNSVSSLKEADLNNIFVYGHSMGGDITLRLIEITDKIKGATLWAPVSAAFPENFLYFVRKRDLKLANKLNEIIEYKFKKEEYGRVSAIANTHYIRIPLIIHHGTQDESVPYEWSLNLTNVLSKNKVNYKFYTYEDDHNFSKKNFYIVLQKDVDFFKSLIK